MTKYGQKYSFGATTPFKYTTWELLSFKTTSGAVLRVSENLRSKGQRSRSPHHQIWAKSTVLEPQLHSDIPDRNFCHSERLTGAVFSIFENLRVKGQGHQINEYE